MKGRASDPEPRWQRWGRNLLLTLGIAQLVGYLSFALHALLGLLISNRIFAGTRGAMILEILQSLPPIAASAVTGYVAAYFLTFRRAAWAIFGFGAAWAVAGFLTTQHHAELVGWALAIALVRAVLVSIGLPLLFLLKRRRLCAGAE